MIPLIFLYSSSSASIAFLGVFLFLPFTFLNAPECFADHILVGDAVVGQGLTPDRVECVVQGLGSKFIGLEDKHRDSVIEQIGHYH